MHRVRKGYVLLTPVIVIAKTRLTRRASPTEFSPFQVRNRGWDCSVNQSSGHRFKVYFRFTYLDFQHVVQSAYRMHGIQTSEIRSLYISRIIRRYRLLRLRMYLVTAVNDTEG